MTRLRLTLLFSAIAWFCGPAVAGDPEVVTFSTEDRLTITGDLWATGQKGGPAVVALHMYPSDRTSWLPVADRFQKAGIDFLAIDMRGYGDSARQRGKDLSEKVKTRDARHFRSMWKDAIGAYGFLVERGVDPGRVAFLGASVGCSVAIDAASREPRILGTVVMTPGGNYLGVETMKHLKDYGDRPMLILSSKEEEAGGAVPISEALGRRGELVIVPGTRIHGTMMFGKVSGIEDRIVAWLSGLVGAGVYLDGRVTTAEDQAVFGDWDMMENGKGRPILRNVGRWLYVAVRLEKGPHGPERFCFAWAKNGEESGARRLVCEFDEQGGRFTLEALNSGRWAALPKALPKDARLGVSEAEALEILIPRRLIEPRGEVRLKVCFGLALKAGNHLSALPLNDNGMNRLADWLDWGLPE